MALVSWSDTYSVKVKRFDEQHKQILTLLNRLHDARSVGRGREVVGEVLAELIAYTKSHFSNEEKLMQSQYYPGYLPHCHEHAELVRKVTEIQTGFAAGRIFISQEVLAFLKGWLERHIRGTDMKYGAHLNHKGVT